MVLDRWNPTLKDLWIKNLAQTWYLFGSYRAGRITWSSSKTFQRTTENKDRWKMISYSGIPYLVKKGSVTFSYQLQCELVQHEWQPIWLHIPPNLDSDWKSPPNLDSEFPDDFLVLNQNNPLHSGFHGTQATLITSFISCCTNNTGFLLLLLYHTCFTWAFLQDIVPIILFWPPLPAFAV